jgi:hypothetical protein
VSAGRLLRSARLGWALSSRSDFVLSAVANGVFEDFGLLLDWAEAILDGVVGGAEVGRDVANVDLCDVVRQVCERDLE